MDVAVLAVLDIGHTIDDSGATLPTVVVDATAHPEVSDLARVHAVDGIGDIRTEVVRSNDLVLLGIKLTTPVVATFAIALDLSQHRQVLVDAAAAGTLVIAHTDPARASEERPLWLAVDIDAAPMLATIGEA